jgi:hypothetical protein
MGHNSTEISGLVMFGWTNDNNVIQLFKSELIRCHFMPPGSSMGPRYFLKLYLSEKSQNC